MTGTRKVFPFPAQFDTSDPGIGADLDDPVDGITAAAAGLPAPTARTVVTKTRETPAEVVALLPRRDDAPEGKPFEE